MVRIKIWLFFGLNLIFNHNNACRVFSWCGQLVLLRVAIFRKWRESWRSDAQETEPRICLEEGADSVTNGSIWWTLDSGLDCCENNDFWVMTMSAGLTPLWSEPVQWDSLPRWNSFWTCYQQEAWMLKQIWTCGAWLIVARVVATLRYGPDHYKGRCKRRSNQVSMNRE